eukprot:TRINITY_DN5463_c0_g1_i1.p2 TRINITY_DN5463_c0_g1~~TRINITY_DN5463_c0_g1_i1.p2  ORF type:complete len:346 (-),score=66.79 TRINITY_DN5463_c0_g1_i1:78-1115(-)
MLRVPIVLLQRAGDWSRVRVVGGAAAVVRCLLVQTEEQQLPVTGAPLLHVFRMLDAKSLARAQQVCRYWRQIGDTDDLWHQLYWKEFASGAKLSFCNNWKAVYCLRASRSNFYPRSRHLLFLLGTTLLLNAASAWWVSVPMCQIANSGKWLGRALWVAEWLAVYIMYKRVSRNAHRIATSFNRIFSILSATFASAAARTLPWYCLPVTMFMISAMDASTTKGRRLPTVIMLSLAAMRLAGVPKWAWQVLGYVILSFSQGLACHLMSLQLFMRHTSMCQRYPTIVGQRETVYMVQRFPQWVPGYWLYSLFGMSLVKNWLLPQVQLPWHWLTVAGFASNVLWSYVAI